MIPSPFHRNRPPRRWPSALFAFVAVLAISLSSRAQSSTNAPSARKTLLVLGDSLAAGYGVDPSESYPAVLQKWLQAMRLPVDVANAGVSGDTTAGGLRRLDWQLRRRIDVLLVALGGNDGLRGIAPASTRSNLLAIVAKARARYPDVAILIAGMQMPPNMGAEYTREFRDVFPAVAREAKATLVPHLLEGVGGKPEFNQPDLIHPTPRGHEIVASNVWQVLEPVLGASRRR